MADHGNRSKVWYLRRINLFASMTDDEIDAMSGLLNDYRIPAGVELLDLPQSDQFMLVKTGGVRLYTRESPRPITVALLGAGRIFGASSTFGADNPEIGAVTLAPSYICFATWQRLVEVLAVHPRVMLQVTRAMAEQVFRAETWQVRLGSRAPGNRLADLLLELNDEFGESRGSARCIPFRLTQADLARMIGVSRETVNRVMAELDQTNVVSRESGQIVLHDLRALESRAAVTRPAPV